jgi:hypothetical protein
MGALGDSFAVFAQPLFDQTDGYMVEMRKAMMIAQLCWNLAMVPESEIDAELERFRPSMNVGESEFQHIRRDIIMPMICRHREMFPNMHSNRKAGLPMSPDEFIPRGGASGSSRQVGRNEPCPCGSGRKYKRCCAD